MVLGFFVEKEHLFVVIEVRANERIAAFDVVYKVRKDALALADPVALFDLVGFAFDDLEQQGKLGNLYGLRVDVNAEDVVEQDSLALVGGQLPFST